MILRKKIEERGQVVLKLTTEQAQISCLGKPPFRINNTDLKLSYYAAIAEDRVNSTWLFQKTPSWCCVKLLFLRPMAQVPVRRSRFSKQ